MSNIEKINNSVDISFGSSVQRKPESDNIGRGRLMLMWALILIGYFLFVVQWYSIGNFAGGYSQIIGNVSNNPALNAMPNWTITLMRGVGSILAGWLVAKIGHRYAVITVMSLMVAAFPFIIFASVGFGNVNEIGIRPINFGMFLFFRLFLAVGGTTLITYTNSVIAKLPVSDRPKLMRINQFGFNGGALFANIFFVFGIGKVINSTPAVWISILSLFVVLILVLLILYVIFGKEVVPVQKNIGSKKLANELTFGKVLQQKYTWLLCIIFAIWLVSVVFINSSTMRSIIEQSPANFRALAQWNLDNNKVGESVVGSMAGATLSTNKSVVPFSGYEWVWPLFICLFVTGFFVGLFIVSPFNKTLYKRKFFIHLMFIIGYVFAAISLACGYFGGYGNKVALAFFFIFIFISGIFLWGVQPVMLSLYQQSPMSDPKYVAIISGLVWGVGYVGYTIAEILLSVSLSYAEPFAFSTNMKEFMDKINESGSTLVQGGIIDWNGASSGKGVSHLIKQSETIGGWIVIVGFWVILLLVFIPIQLLPSAGVKDKEGNFKPFDVDWKPWYWNFKKDDILIK